MTATEVKAIPLPQEHAEFFVQAALVAVIRSVSLWLPPLLLPSDRPKIGPKEHLTGNEWAMVWHTGRVLRELATHLTRKPADVADCLHAANDFMGQVTRWVAAAVSDPEGVNARIDEAGAADLQGIDFARYVYKDYPDIEAASTAFVEWMLARAEEPA